MTNLEFLTAQKEILAQYLIDWNERYGMWMAKVGPDGEVVLCPTREAAIETSLGWLDEKIEETNNN